MLTRTDSRPLAGAEAAGPGALVIGSGFGGLAAAVRLGAKGYRVTVLERLDAPGGRAYVYRQDGFTFDGGPTIITVPHLLEELWQLAGRRLEDDIDLRHIDPYYRIRFEDGSVFTYSGDPDAMAREVERFSPVDLDGYERFMAHSERLCRVAFDQLGDVPFTSAGKMARWVPDLVRLGGLTTVYKLVSNYIRDPKLRIVFSFHPLLIGGSPLRASGVYAMIPALERRWGVHFAMGGTGALVDGLVRLIEHQGGTIRYGADVEEILVEDGRARGVRLAGGEEVPGDLVVSNADSATTYHDLLPDSVRRRWPAWRVRRASHSMGLFVWYFGTKRRYEDVDHHTKLMGPRYVELLRDIFERKVLAEDFSLYLHRPTAIDTSLAPHGCDTFYVLSPVPNLSAGIDWAEEAEPYRRAIEKKLSETLLPGLQNEIVTSHMLTPADFKSRLRAFRGSGFSLEPLLSQSAWLRPHNRAESVDGLYLVGAGTHPGAGVPGVLSSARVLDEVVPDASPVR